MTEWPRDDIAPLNLLVVGKEGGDGAHDVERFLRRAGSRPVSR
jgi:hypothetical protein